MRTSWHGRFFLYAPLASGYSWLTGGSSVPASECVGLNTSPKTVGHEDPPHTQIHARRGVGATVAIARLHRDTERVGTDQGAGWWHTAKWEWIASFRLVCWGPLIPTRLGYGTGHQIPTGVSSTLLPASSSCILVALRAEFWKKHSEAAISSPHPLQTLR